MDVSGLAQNGGIDGIHYKNGKYTLEKDIKWWNSTFDAYIVLGVAAGNGIEFDGKGHTITIDYVLNLASEGLFHCTGNTSNVVVVKNLTLKSTVQDGGCGGIVHGASAYFLVENCKQKGLVDIGGLGGGSGGICGAGCNNFTIKNCEHEGLVQSAGSAGVSGSGCHDFTILNSKNKGHVGSSGSAGIAAYGSYNFTISHCQNHGSIGTIDPNAQEQNAGAGICGYNCYAFTIDHCNQYGDINDTSAGGIVGSGSGSASNGASAGSITVKKCTTKGNLNATYGGGICGQHTGSTLNTASTGIDVIVDECIFEGNIVGAYCGGIVGEALGYKNISLSAPGTVMQAITIQNCEFVGKMSNASTINCGGIVGPAALRAISNVTSGAHTLTFSVTVNILNCSSKCDITATNAGICGNDYYYSSGSSTFSFTNSSLNVDGCVSHGKLLGGAAGILGSSAYYIINTAPATVSNCYSTGYISSGSYGIAGPETNNIHGTLTVTNCYASGHIDTTGAYGICSASSSSITNCYSRDTTQSGGQNLHMIKGRHQTLLTAPTAPKWQGVKESYPILVALRSSPWSKKHYDNYLDTPQLD